MRIPLLLIVLFATTPAFADWGLKIDLERQIREKVAEVDNAICNLNEKVASLQRRIEDLEKRLPQPTPAEAKPKNQFRAQGVDEKPQEECKDGWKIVCYTRAKGCDHCDRVKEDGIQESAEKSGWKWQNVEDDGLVPRFVFVYCKDGGCQRILEHRGYFISNDRKVRRGAFFDLMSEALKLKENRESFTSWTFERPDGYRSGWTYPGDIRAHLLDDHGLASVNGMTKEECEQLHDNLHNAGGK